MAADKYGFIFVNTEVDFVVYNFTNTEPNVTKSYYVNNFNLTGCGFTITDDDQFYVSQGSSINVYSIVRDGNLRPINLDYIKSINASRPDCFSNLSFSKSGNLVGLRNQGIYANLVSVFDSNWVETVYCTPGNVPLNNGCNDLAFGYTVLLSNPKRLYILPDLF